MSNIWTRLFEQLKRMREPKIEYFTPPVTDRNKDGFRHKQDGYKEEMRRYQSSGIYPKPGQDDYPIYCRMCGYMGPMSSTYPYESEKDVYGNPGRSCPNCGSLLQTQYLKYGGHDGNLKYPDLPLDGDER